MFTFEYSPEEDKVEDQEKTTRCSQTDHLVNIMPVLSPAKKVYDDVASPISVDITEVSPINNIEHPQSIAKTEKGSSEEGFCCVMSKHDGVVL